MYDLPDELRVEVDGAVRIVTMNRPDDRDPASATMLFGLTRPAQTLDSGAGPVAAQEKGFSAARPIPRTSNTS